MSNLHSVKLKAWEPIDWGADEALNPLKGWLYKTHRYETGLETSLIILIDENLQNSVENLLITSAELFRQHVNPLVIRLLVIPASTIRSDFSTPLTDFYYGDNISEKYLTKQVLNNAPDAIIILSDSKLSIQSIAGVPVHLCFKDESQVIVQVQTSLTSPRSECRKELYSKAKRSSVELVEQITNSYGRDLTLVNYTQGVGIYGHILIAEQLNSISEVGRELDSALSQGPLSVENPFGENPTGANLASSIWAYELSKHLNSDKWNHLLDVAANMYKINPDPSLPPIPCDPIVRTEDMFYSAAVLGRAFEQHGHSSYLDMLDAFYEMVDLQQDNGLFWHSKTSPYYWSRGNGFAILGLSQYLTYVPSDRYLYNTIREQFVNFFQTISKYQDISGGFHEIIDIPATYIEFTSTCIIGFAALRGKYLGILNDSVDELIHGAWYFLKNRIDTRGNVTDACFNTGLQPDLESYYLRPAVTGQDDRSGSMALLFCSEVLRTGFSVDQPSQ